MPKTAKAAVKKDMNQQTAITKVTTSKKILIKASHLINSIWCQILVLHLNSSSKIVLYHIVNKT